MCVRLLTILWNAYGRLLLAKEYVLINIPQISAYVIVWKSKRAFLLWYHSIWFAHVLMEVSEAIDATWIYATYPIFAT